jgi:uncharacterized protein DUF5753
MLTFPDSNDNDLVYVEGHLRDPYLEQPHAREIYEQMFDPLVAMCMSAEQSAILIGQFSTRS